MNWKVGFSRKQEFYLWPQCWFALNGGHPFYRWQWLFFYVTKYLRKGR